jgi:hypothetical protein
LDNGRVQKALRTGWVNYNTRYTLWGGTQPARLEMESGLDRRLFIIDIEMTPEKEAAYKEAQHAQANMSREERIVLADEAIAIRNWFTQRMTDAILDPPTGVLITEDVAAWLARPEVRSYEADLFRRLCIGYAMLTDEWVGGEPLVIDLDRGLLHLLESSLIMRRNVMDSDVRLIKDTFWMQDITRSTLLKEIQRIITHDYTGAKRWIEENLHGQTWFHEYVPDRKGRGRRGVMCRIGPLTEPERVKEKWGVQDAE